jgi:DNA/RNA-binding domain of Phe-tRNA-synthetase-like protein
MFSTSDAWKTGLPGAWAGILVLRDVANPDHHDLLDARKAELERELRSRFADKAQIAALPVLQAYAAYYKRFKKTYHVQLQLESVALKGKPIPRVSALVEAMFMAELENLLLTAGHDLANIQPPVKLELASGIERYRLLGGQEQVLKAGDMMMRDRASVISSVLYGPDDRTRILPETRQVLFAVYAPPGIEESAVQAHLGNIRSNVMLLAPDARTELLQVYGTS